MTSSGWTSNRQHKINTSDKRYFDTVVYVQWISFQLSICVLNTYNLINWRKSNIFNHLLRPCMVKWQWSCRQEPVFVPPNLLLFCYVWKSWRQSVLYPMESKQSPGYSASRRCLKQLQQHRDCRAKVKAYDTVCCHMPARSAGTAR